MALLLPLNDLQGEIRGLAGTKAFNAQLDTGEFQMVTLQAAVKESGAFEVDEVDDGTVDVRENSRQGVKYSNKKCDQGTQTALFSIFPPDDVELHWPIHETHF